MPRRVARLRWAIRTKLLALLLPAMGLMLALDSWSDYHARAAAVDRALDEVLVQPLVVLEDSMQLDALGEPTLQVPFEVLSMFEAVPSLHKHLYVGIARASGGPARTLLGTPGLPAPPAGLVPASMPNLLTAPDSRAWFYDGVFRDYPVRVATVERTMRDAAGRVFHVRIQAAESTLRRESARRESLLRELERLARTLALAALVVLLGIGWALRPLLRLERQVRARPDDDLTPVKTNDVPREVESLVHAVNDAMARHRALLEGQERFLADAAHQLRTPLAVMTTQADYAQRAAEPHAAAEALDAIRLQLRRTRRMADQLLALSHASAARREPAGLCDLNSVGREVVLQALPMALERDIDLGWMDARGEVDEEGGEPQAPVVPVRAIGAELHEVLANLVHNALRHTPAGGQVTVSVGIEGREAVAEVVDTGPGLAPERREAVFERFHGLSQASRAGDTAGAGLGLAIARAYARRNGGDVRLHDAAQGPGLRARLALPLAA